jgi:hypothetical protein
MAVKPFPRAGAFAVLDGLGGPRVGIIHEYPMQVTAGAEDRDGNVSPITKLDASTCEFHVLDADGTTKAELKNVDIERVRQARISEIPRKRRPSEVQAKKFGYAP